MGFKLGQSSTASKKTSNKKFVLGSTKPVQKDDTKKKLTVKEKRLNEGSVPTMSYALSDNLKKAATPVNTEMVARVSGTKPVKIGTTEAAKAVNPKTTQIDQRLHFGGEALKDDNRSYIGMNILPAYKEDDPLTKVGKGIVNYGVGGALSLASNVSGGLGQAMMQTVSNTDKAIRGEKLDFSEKTLRKDILPKQYDEALTKLAKTGKGGEIASQAIDMLINAGLDPSTYIGGGIVDDLSKAGIMGKASKPSTEFVKLIGERQKAMLAKQAVKKVAGVADDVTTPKVEQPIAEPVKAQADNTIQNVTGDTAKQPTQTVASKINTEQVNTPTINKVAQKGAQEVTTPKVETVTDYAPKTAKQQKYVEQVTAKLPNNADGLSKKIAELETAKSVEKDEHKLLKINLQLFAAKTKLKTFTDIPTGDLPEGTIERGFSKNVRTDKSMPDEIRETFDEKPLGYKQKTNEETLAKAETIMAKGQASAVSEYYTMLNGNHYQPETVPLAKLIAKNAQAAGDTATARQVLSDAAVKLTEAGQFSQAAKILRESDPETFLITLQKQINKLNKEGEKFYKKKWNEITLTDGEMAKIGKIKAGDAEAFETAMNEVHDRIALEIPSNGWEKFDSWRRMAMLLNPTTHVRNLIGNTVMGGMQKTSDAIGAAIESIVIRDPNKRTKSILWRTDANRVKTVSTAWETNKRQLMKGGRWDLESSVGTLKELNSVKPVFKTMPLEATNKFSKDLLNAEDNIFVKAMWENSLGSFMKARNITDVTDEAIEYATRRAYEATFKQANLLSTTISKIKNVPVVGRLTEGAIPFSKTPSNIAMRAFEYSPAGIMKFLYSVGAKKGAATVIEDLSKSLTGTGIAALGFTLAAGGWARGKTSTSDKVESLRTKRGNQANSITTALGSYTLDWAQPSAIPFFTGVAMYEELQNPKYDGKLGEAIMQSIYKGGDTLFEMTMMRNIKQILGYGSTTQKIGGVMLSYIEQAIPSILGKMARSIDPSQRETYDTNPAKEEWNKIVAKVPGLSYTLPEKVDNFGEVMKNSSALEQFLSPGYAKGKDARPFMKELERLYGLEKNTDIIPSVTSGKLTDNHIDYVMAADEYTKYKKTYGSAIMNGYTDSSGIKHIGLNTLIESPAYKSLKTDKEKFKRITKLYENASEIARKEFLKGRGVK